MMKINEITLEHFGKYNNETLTFGKGLNIVYGQNEAGKSTLFSSLMTLLYGFKPATKEAHPYLSWDQNQLSLHGRFEDGQGPYRVERKLLSSPVGRLYRADQEIKINNHPLKQVDHLSKQTFESIYALTLKDMVQLSETPWSEVEDRLILNYGIDAFQSPREVAATIEEEMRKLYNPRGQAKNTSVKQLEAAIKQLIAEKRHVEERQAEVLTIEEDLKKVEKALDKKEKVVFTLSEQVDWWEKHGHLVSLQEQSKTLKSELAALEKRLGDRPKKIEGYKSHDSHIKDDEEEIRRLSLKKERIDQGIQPLTDDEEKCLKQRTQIKTLMNIARDNRQQIQLLEKEEVFLKDKRSQLERHVSDVLKSPTEDHIKNLSEINLMFLEGKFDKITDLKKDMEVMQRELFALASDKQKTGKGLSFGISLLGGLIFAGGSYLNQAVVNYLGVLLLSFGLFKLFFSNGQSIEEDKRLYEQKYAFNQIKIDEIVNEIRSQINFISLDKERIIENGPRIYQVLYQGKDMADEFLRMSQSYLRNREKIDLTKDRLNENLKMIFSRFIQVDEMNALIENADLKERQNKDVLKSSGDLYKQIQDLQLKVEAEKEQMQMAEDYLKQIGEGQVIKGLELLNSLETLKGRLIFIEGEIEQLDPSGVMRREISIRPNVSEELAHISQRKLDLSREKEAIEDMRILRQKYKSDLEHLLPKTDLFEVESQLLSLRQELEQVKIAYDELQILKAIIEGFDQSYREHHQPDILKRTGMYFKQFSKGKYQKIYNDDAFGKTSLLIRENGQDHLVDSVLSQGARDQLYLSLRLALAEELDSGKDRLPLFLDEVFVNWDMERLDEGIEFLNTLSNERQVILFTCHEWLVERIKEKATPHLVLLNN